MDLVMIDKCKNLFKNWKSKISSQAFKLAPVSPEVLGETNKAAKAGKITVAPEINAVWDKEPWLNKEPYALNNYMGERPLHFPETQIKCAYDRDNLYLIFKVKDKYILACAQGYHDRVWEDSCVEFFFCPGEDIAQGYFNLEINCGGCIYFGFQKIPRNKVVNILELDCAKLKIAHSLPKQILAEIEETTEWCVEVKLPFSVIERYYNLKQPSLGSIWLVNFYKCADKSSHPHWLTWNRVDNPRPDFHRPEYFGRLVFE